MSRNRIISQTQLVYVGPSPATGFMFSSGNSGVNLLNQIHRIQSVGMAGSTTRTDVNQYGQLDAVDRLILESPTSSINLDYLVANTYNASVIGFTVDGTASCISGILNKSQDEKNYFLLTVAEGNDAIGNSDASSTKTTRAVGNGFISNFTAQASVGNFATESVSVEGLNLFTYLGSTGLPSPAVVPASGSRVSGPTFSIPVGTSGVDGAVPAIRPGDITVDFNDPVFGPKVSDLKIQSYNISVPLSRQPLNKLGSAFAFSREIQFPVNITCSIEAELGDLVTGDLSSLICNDSSQDIIVNLRKPQCGGGGPIAVQYKFLGGKLDSQSYNGSIGQNERVTLSYTSTIGGPQSQKGLFISGSLQ